MVSHHHPSQCPLCEFFDIYHFVRHQEAFIGNNMTSIFTIIGKIHSQDENNNNGMIVIVETLLQQQKKINDLEAKCSALYH
jgi:hypothetical protein